MNKKFKEILLCSIAGISLALIILTTLKTQATKTNILSATGLAISCTASTRLVIKKTTPSTKTVVITLLIFLTSSILLYIGVSKQMRSWNPLVWSKTSEWKAQKEKLDEAMKDTSLLPENLNPQLNINVKTRNHRIIFRSADGNETFTTFRVQLERPLILNEEVINRFAYALQKVGDLPQDYEGTIKERKIQQPFGHLSKFEQVYFINQKKTE